MSMDVMSWMRSINIGGFIRGNPSMHHSAHGPHTKKQSKRLPNRERNRRAKQSRMAKKKGGKR